MNKPTAIISIVLAGVLGLAIGHLATKSSLQDEILAASEREVEIRPDRAPAEAAPAARAAGAGQAPAAPGGVERFKIPVTAAQPQKGPADALITIVEISDFECPFCGRVNPTLASIFEEYGDKVRVVWRNNPLPFHRNAPLAHAAAMEAFDQGGSEKFFAFHDILFANRTALQRADLDRYAGQLGLDMGQFAAALDNNEHAAVLAADKAVATTFQARGTPHFFINGIRLRGAQPLAKFKEIIDAEITRAEALVRSGTPKAQIYAALTRGALTKASAPTPSKNKQGGARPGRPDPSKTYKVPVAANLHPQKGPDDALVTIVEVSDFECPFCGRVNPTMAQIREEYGNDVRIVWFNNPLPFHRNAPLAHQAAMEAFDQGGSDKFWAMHDILFENRSALQRADLDRYAGQIGLNMTQFASALDNNEHQAKLTRDQGIARQFGARGTPAFFVNGRFLSGAQPFPAFKTLIDEELAKARAKVAAGTPRANIYAETIKTGEARVAAGAAAPAQQANRPDPNRVYNIAVPRNAPFKGGANAQVVIQEFSDFECPFCGRVNPTIAQVMREYGDRVKVIWRHHPLPFHQNAQLAHEASAEIFAQGGSEKFWAYHDILFENRSAMTRPDLERYAEQVGGINMGRFRAALDNNTHAQLVNADKGAPSAAGARIGTPSFFINGRLLQGAQPFEKFKEAIDAALAAR